MSIYQPGEVVADRYRISKALSQGGMGAVYLAEQISLGRQVALKVILAHHQDSEALRRRFDHEARAVCKLHHPNVITYHDYGHDDAGRPFLVMEFLAGYPGTDFVYGQTVPSVAACIHVLGQLASALADAHQHGIIHRDLKWSNAMIVPQSHDPLFTKLIDFGILKVAADGSTGDQRRELTRTGVLLGTPQYMSPEAIVGRPIDGRADQYSLAVMAYELLTGRRPFETESQLELLRQHVQELPPPMDDIGPARERIPALEAAVFRGMAKQPHDRFPDITAFHAALARAA
ncbi:MAG: serine/threonine protein kinase, partial [Deltaproteobacteria bacterium]